MAFAGKQMELENIILSEISQFQKTKGQMLSLRVDADRWGAGQGKKGGTLDWAEKREGRGGGMGMRKMME